MSKPKFKVGDRVRILDGSNIKNYYGGWSTHMKGCVGKIATVRRLCSHYTQNSYLLEGSIYSWDERGLEPVNPEKIIIYRNGSEVIAKNTATGKTGVARCNPADEFDFNTGVKLAFERLINPEPEKPKYYTGKVVCVKAMTKTFTKGKIYEIVDGKMRPNAGFGDIFTYKDFDDVNLFNCSQFIELVE